MTNTNSIRPGSMVSGPVLPEAIEVLAVVPLGSSLKIIGRGLRTGLARDTVVTQQQLGQLVVSAEREPFDGDARRFRLAVEAHRLGLAYEYDPFFSLSIARVDPLPHQLEAVYGYFMRLPRIRFLLADDPGAGKTIMAGLTIKELKARGLVRRVLIVTPANLTFQWQRELADKFREKLDVVRGDVLRANYGQNPWQEKDQVITSVSWVSLIEDARESLLRSRWDLVIVDEAHKMSARSDDHKTYAYKLGESLSKMTDHFLLMTATPHKGDPAHFRRFLALLDPDVYGSIESLEQAMRVHEAPFYLRRTKEALVSFPDADTGEVRKLFTKREVRTAAFDLDGEELEFYDELTRYVEDQSIAAAGDQTARGRAVGFTMAMLQRRMASSIYAVRRSLERMRDRRQKILDDPEDYRREQIDRRMPDDFDDLTEEEQERIVRQLEDEVLSADPAVLRDEIARLSRLIEQAQTLEGRDQQSKLLMLRAVLMTEGVLGNPPRTERGRRRTLHTRSPNCHARISAMTKATGDWWVFYRPNELEDAERLNKGRTYWWRCNEKTAKGDVALLYVRGPTSALTAVLKATSDAYQDDSAQEFTTHRWCCDVRVVQVLKAPLTIGKMRRDRELWKCWGLLRANFQAPKPPRVPSEVLRLLAKHVPELGDVLKEPRSNAKRRGRSPSRSK